jgi:hypothetical protein
MRRSNEVAERLKVVLYLDRYRREVLVVIGMVVFLGLLSRVAPMGVLVWDKYLGDALYAAAFYLALSFLWPQGAVSSKVALVSAYVVAIELFQLTPFPAYLNRSDYLPVRLFAYLILGSTFGWWDLPAYGVGIIFMAGIDKKYLLRSEQNFKAAQ